jgi:hypothetical protein
MANMIAESGPVIYFHPLTEVPAQIVAVTICEAVWTNRMDNDSSR